MREAQITSGKTVAATQAAFRKELNKIMPGYNWTVHKSKTPDYIEATGIQSSGFNRLSTLSVARTEPGVYTVKSAGYGTRSPWAHTCTDGTLARALRGLQGHYEEKATLYRGLANALQIGRRAEQ